MSEFFKWKDEFSVNDNDMDRQHQIFLETLNQIYSAVGKVDFFDVFDRSVSTLQTYIEYHFKEEEMLCAASGYPHLERQKKQHEYFRVVVNDLVDSRHTIEAKDLCSLLMFMRDWFLKHILEEDQGYADFISQDRASISA